MSCRTTWALRCRWRQIPANNNHTHLRGEEMDRREFSWCDEKEWIFLWSWQLCIGAVPAIRRWWQRPWLRGEGCRYGGGAPDAGFLPGFQAGRVCRSAWLLLCAYTEWNSLILRGLCSDILKGQVAVQLSPFYSLNRVHEPTKLIR